MFYRISFRKSHRYRGTLNHEHKVHEIGLRARLLHFLENPISWDGMNQSECEECATRSKDLG